MKLNTLYRYKREDGGISVSPNKPDCEYNELVRIVADQGKLVTQDGENLFFVIDADNANGWYEVDAPETSEEELEQAVSATELSR